MGSSPTVDRKASGREEKRILQHGSGASHNHLIYACQATHAQGTLANTATLHVPAAYIQPTPNLPEWLRGWT